MKEKIKDIFELSQIFSSGKRLLLLFFLKEEPMGYTLITKSFEKIGVPIGSSEVYKHLKKLIDTGFVSKKTNSYVLTLKGLKAVENVEEIMKTPPTLPEVKISFKKRLK